MNAQATPSPRTHVLLVLDSCRYDTFQAAQPRNMLSLGPLERRFSYSTWTAPSHVNLLMGILPHPGDTDVLAAQVYRRELERYRERLGIPDLDLSSLAPGLWLPSFLQSLGYHTSAFVSMPVLNPATIVNRGFHAYHMAERHDDLEGILDHLRFAEGRPSFVLINTGETHYPYTVAGHPQAPLPRLHGFHGVVRGRQGADPDATPFDRSTLDTLRERQVEAVRRLDQVVERLYRLLPHGTWLTITSDHGEAFGEDGYFGHGPVVHPKVLEVPLVEGLVPT